MKADSYTEIKVHYSINKRTKVGLENTYINWPLSSPKYFTPDWSIKFFKVILANSQYSRTYIYTKVLYDFQETLTLVHMLISQILTNSSFQFIFFKIKLEVLINISKPEK